jgi:hypothetical protein
VASVVGVMVGALLMAAVGWRGRALAVSGAGSSERATPSMGVPVLALTAAPNDPPVGQSSDEKNRVAVTVEPSSSSSPSVELVVSPLESTPKPAATVHAKAAAQSSTPKPARPSVGNASRTTPNAGADLFRYTK